MRPLELLRGAIRVVSRCITAFQLPLCVTHELIHSRQVLSVGDDCLLLAPANQKAWAGFTDKIMATSEISISVDQIRHELSN